VTIFDQSSFILLLGDPFYRGVVSNREAAGVFRETVAQRRLFDLAEPGGLTLRTFAVAVPPLVASGKDGMMRAADAAAFFFNVNDLVNVARQIERPTVRDPLFLPYADRLLAMNISKELLDLYGRRL
jgi:hypothetical protein